MTLLVDSGLLVVWAMSEWYVVVGDIVEEMKLILWKQETSSNRVNWSITPALVEESTIFVKLVEEVGVRW